MEFIQQLLAVRAIKRTAFLPVTVGVGSGLAYARRPRHDTYDLIHVQSGWFLCRGPYSQHEARLWLERLAPLMDWTQDEQAIRAVEWAFMQQVVALREVVAYERACAIYDALAERSGLFPTPSLTCSACRVRVSYWLYQGDTLCYPCMQHMCDLNSDNAAVFGPILQALHQSPRKE